MALAMGTKRIVIMVITSLAAALTLLWMQNKFEAADERSALNLVQSYRSAAGVSINDVLSHRHQGKAVQWSTATQSACFQHVRVHAVVVDDPLAQPKVYAFAVDINRPSIHPANEHGKELLAALDKPLPRPPTASALASASAPPSASALPPASALPAASGSAEP